MEDTNIEQVSPSTEDYSRLIDVRVGQDSPTQGQSFPRSNQRPTCPQGFSGLLPHPDTCKKFLQCANGATYTMDCGPGTVYNPITTVCDWPHSVPGCSDGWYQLMITKFVYLHGKFMVFRRFAKQKVVERQPYTHDASWTSSIFNISTDHDNSSNQLPTVRGSSVSQKLG